MRSFKKIFILGIALFTPFLGYAETRENIKKSQMISNLNFIHHLFSFNYALTEWKETHLGWNLDQEIDNAKKEINESKGITTAQYRKILSRFFNSAKDYHVGIRFDSTEEATLPFSIVGVDGHYYVMAIDEDSLPYAQYAINIGDEVLALNGEPVKDIISELKKLYTRNANEQTDAAFAEKFFTHRAASLGVDVPKGPVTVKFKSRTTDKPYSYQLIWEYTPEKIQHHYNFNNPLENTENEKKPFKNLKKLLKDHSLLFPLYHSFHDRSCFNSITPNDIGSKESFVPILGKIWWTAGKKNFFDAYLYETPEGKKVGYVRIATYIGGYEELLDFAQIIDFFEERTDALVIDQLGNPGGSVFYLYALASMLTDQPLVTPKHKLSLSSNFIANATVIIPELEELLKLDLGNAGETLNGIPLTSQTLRFLLEFFQFVVSEWNNGKSMTDSTYLMGVDSINPHPYVRYTKPILLLINHLDFSGGDFFPAILQDNNRVTTLGTTTAGAGGVVTGTTFPNRQGIASFNYTFSIAERPNGMILENLGVTPDIEYQITRNDLLYGYADYASAIHEAVNNLLNPSNVQVKPDKPAHTQSNEQLIKADLSQCEDLENADSKNEESVSQSGEERSIRRTIKF